MKIVLAIGGFDPIHSGHIEYFNDAATLGDRLIIGVNSDEWLIRKKGKFFMPLRERACIVGNLKVVSEVIQFDDSDGSACAAIEKVVEQYPDDEVIFVNGGDRTSLDIPEIEKFYNGKVTFVFGVGGVNKMNSSQWILNRWKYNEVSASAEPTSVSPTEDPKP